MTQLFKIHAGHEWAYIVLDEATGLFSAHGSYGTFAFVWPPEYRSEPLADFLSDLGFDYFVGKTRGCSAREFDQEATVRRLKKWIIDARKNGDCTQVEARGAWDSLVGIDETNEPMFVHLIYDDPDLYRVIGSDAYEAICRRYTPECTEFWRVIWPEFLKTISARKAA